MASLYEIDKEIMATIDEETGEILDFDRLNELIMKREQKIENVALWVKNLTADIAAFKAEKDAFAERQKRAETKVESLKRWLTEACDGTKFATAKCVVSFRKSERVEIPDERCVPPEYITETITYKPDKDAIKKAIKGGAEINGCQLVEALNVSVK